MRFPPASSSRNLLFTWLEPLFAPTAGLLLSLICCCCFLWGLGESPWVLIEAFKASLLTPFGIGYTLFYATPLIFTGLSVAVSFHCGLFNIGAEGQLYLGALAVTTLGIFTGSLPSYLALPLGLIAALAGGGLWGGLAGFLKAKRGSHEVIVTILLNFIGVSLASWATLYPLRNIAVQNPETLPVGKSYELHTLHFYLEKIGIQALKVTPVNSALGLALASAGFCYFLLFFTTFGYELRAVGFNPTASRFAGISVTRNTFLALALSGALAGMVGVNEIMGYQHKLVEGFSPGYGFTGIAVALLARNHPLGVILSALLFGTLHNSSRELEFLSEKVTKELSLVLQGTLIAFISAHYLVGKLWQKRVS